MEDRVRVTMSEGIADVRIHVLASPLAGLDPHEISDVSGIIDRLRELLVESGLAARLGLIRTGESRRNLPLWRCDRNFIVNTAC